MPRAGFSADEVTLLYRVHWQVELLFKELKSHDNLQKFNTQEQPIVEGLIWASLLSFTLKRAVASKAAEAISFFKAAMNADIWFIPLLQAIADKEYIILKERLELAYIYLEKNALSSQQKKSKGYSILVDIFAYFNS